MSPVSRRRKRATSSRSGQRVVRLAEPVNPEPCDCPACSDADFDPDDLIDALVTGGAELLKTDDPVEAELFAASFLAAGDLAGDGFAEALDADIVPTVAEIATPEALAVLLALDTVHDGTAAAEAARRLQSAGVAAPTWADEVREPLRFGQCRRFADPAGIASMLVCIFDRAGSSYGFVIQIDHLDCDAAANLVLFPAEVLDEVVGTLAESSRRAGVTVVEESLDPAELRWQVERALDARADHDREADPTGSADEFEEGDEEGPGYHLLAVLLRAWIRALPEPTRPAARHHDGPAALSLLDDMALIVAAAQQIQTAGPRRAGGPAKLPAKRRKSAPPAPIYQIKVGLRGAKPPIWRRLELPADTSLATLHDIIQVAFGWNGSHLHVFETEYGDFGVADRELGYRAEAPVTLEQVASGVGDRFRYTYDFGDSWEHEIVVEKVLPRQAIAYPRCTGGRRAAPPDDCGGVWGYAELVEVLGDPGHPDHGDRLEWFGLASAADFQPARFDAAEITQALQA
ncbi:plasmid pRiA4b ORF-3 family protein [Micromonospora chokoriensis]